MKNRIFLLMIAALLIFCITACGAKTGPVSTADTQASDAKTEEKDTADAGTGDEAEETTTKPKMTRTQSTPSSDVDEGFIITPEDVVVRAGEPVDIDIRLENKSNRKTARFEIRVDNESIPISGAEITMEDTFCYAVEGIHEFNLINGTWSCDTLENCYPQEIHASEPVCRFTLSIPADARAGEYVWKIDRFHVVESVDPGVEFDADIRYGKIVVYD